MVIITDYEMIKEAFSMEEISSRLTTPKLKAINKLIKQDLWIYKLGIAKLSVKTQQFLMKPIYLPKQQKGSLF